MEQLTDQAARKATAKEINKRYGELKNYRNDALKIDEMRDRIEARISESIKTGHYATYLSNFGEDVCVGKEILELLKAEYRSKGFNFNYTLGNDRIYGFFGKKHPHEIVTIGW